MICKFHLACFKQTTQKPASLMVLGCMSGYRGGKLHIWKGTINAGDYMEVLAQQQHNYIVPFREGLEYFSKSMLH